MDRRRVLQGMAAVTGIVLTNRTTRAWAANWQSPDNPFRLGVASGFPTDQSLVLWTMLAPDPLAPENGMPPVEIDVDWEIATDERFRRIVARGSAVATPAFTHSVRVEVPGLAPARHYWYRFTAAGHRSRVGRSRTLPPATSRTKALHIAVANCQHYEHGNFAAFAHIAAAAPDLILHLGDYIYEGAPVKDRVRAHVGTLCRTLADYRQRYTLYQLDPALQDAHAAAPWLSTWDDHEVANDYSGIYSGRSEEPAVFLARRTAAYQAYFEHMPLPPSATPRGSETPIFARRSVGSLATIHMLDRRQYRSAQACALPNRAGGNRAEDSCTERLQADRTMLGTVQEAWFDAGLASSRAQWTLIAQGTIMQQVDQQPGEQRAWATDDWDGYPAARARLLATLQRQRVTNPVVLSGDIHAFMVGGIHAMPEQPDSPLLAPEFVATSVSTDPRPQQQFDEWRAENPDLLLAEGRYRGYLSLQIAPQRLQADLIALQDGQDARSDQRVLQSYVVEAGSPRILQA